MVRTKHFFFTTSVSPSIALISILYDSYFGALCGTYFLSSSVTYYGCSITSQAEVASSTLSAVKSQPTNAAGAYRIIGGAYPQCAENISSSCPKLYSSVVGCWNAASPQYCYCQNLLQISCQAICTVHEQPAAYLAWVRSTCGALTNTTIASSIATVFSPDWQDYIAYQNMARKNLFPWNWTVGQDITEANHYQLKCPSRFSKLGSFVLINLVTLLTTIFLGRRTTVLFTTRGFFGTLGSPWWPIKAVLTTGMMIGITFLNALLVHSTPGFDSTPIIHLALLWLCRPRIGWFAILLVKINWENGMYVSMGSCAIFSEMIMQGLGAYYMGRTVNFARLYGYYFQGRIEDVVVPWGKAAHIMYAGALLWITGVGFVVLAAIWTFLGLGQLINALVRQLFIKGGSLSKGTKEVMAKVVDDISESWNALGSAMKSSFKQRILLHFAKNLPPMGHLAQLAGGNALAGQGNGRQDEIAVAHHISGGEQPNLLENGERRLETPAIGENSTVDANQQLHSWLYNMGLSPRALSRMISVFGWMVLPFIGQWLFWVGYVDLAEDL